MQQQKQTSKTLQMHCIYEVTTDLAIVKIRLFIINAQRFLHLFTPGVTDPVTAALFFK